MLALTAFASPAAAQHLAPPPPRRDSTAAERLVGRALVWERAGQSDSAARAYRRAIDEARRVNDSLGLAGGEYRLGILFWSRGSQDSAVVHLEAARALRARLPEPVEYARVLNGLGAAYYQSGLYEPAIRAFSESERLRRTLRDTVGLIRTLTNVGKTYQDWGQLARARAKLQEAVESAPLTSRSATSLGYAYNSLALVLVDQAQYDSAELFIARSVDAYMVPGALMTRGDSSDASGNTLSARGQLLLRRGDLRAARPVLDSAYASAVSRGSVRGQALALLHLSECASRSGDQGDARRLALAALAAARSVNQRVLALEALRQLAAVEEARGQPAVALDYLKRYQQLRDSVFDQDAAQRVSSHEAQMEAADARRDNALLQQEQRAQAVTISRQRIAVAVTLAVLAVVSTLIALLVRATRAERARSSDLSAANADLERVNEELRRTMAEVRTLSGLIPICANCKRVRDDQGYWQAVETFVSRRSDATFSHSICQSCGPVLYGDMWSSTGELPTPAAPADPAQTG